MKKWIKTFAGNKLKPIAAAESGEHNNDGGAALQKENHKPFVLPPPITDIKNKIGAGGDGTSLLLEKQMEEEKRLADAMENMITQ